EARLIRYEVCAATWARSARRAARRNSLASTSPIDLPIHRLLFLTKIWTTRQPAETPRSTARGVPPAMDWWAPIKRSAVLVASTVFRTARFYREQQLVECRRSKVGGRRSKVKGQRSKAVSLPLCHPESFALPVILSAAKDLGLLSSRLFSPAQD